MKLRKNKIYSLSSFNFTLKKQAFSTSISQIRENVCFYFMIGLYSDTVFLWCGNTKYLELIKRRSKVQKNMSCEHALNFDQ